MSGTAVTGDSYDTGKPESGISYVIGTTFAIIILLVTLSYASYKCRRSIHSSSPLGDDDNHHLMAVSRGVDDDVLMTFPAFVYSEHMMTKSNKGSTSPEGNGSGCSICLVDYKPTDVIRLLPECGHLFHRNCVDTWLKVHPSCPVCRNSPLPVRKPSIQLN